MKTMKAIKENEKIMEMNLLLTKIFAIFKDLKKSIDTNLPD